MSGNVSPTAGPRPPGDGAEQALRGEIIGLLPDLRAFARFLLRDRSTADDLVQDTVMRALTALQQFQRGSNLKAWLFTIERNAFYEQVRRRKRETAALERGRSEPPASVSTVNGSDISDLQRVLWTLPALLREALVLVGAQELTHEEAATICGVPVGTMKARVSRGRAKLTIAMREERPGPCPGPTKGRRPLEPGH